MSEKKNETDLFYLFISRRRRKEGAKKHIERYSMRHKNIKMQTI